MSGRKILLHGKLEYALWLTNPRMSIVLVLLVLIHSIVITPLAQGAEAIHTSMSLLEPLAALSNSTVILLLLPFGFLVLISDFPRMTQGFLLQLYRVGRVNWVLGELLQMAASAVTYLLCMMGGTLLLTLPYHPDFSDQWSSVATDYVRLMGSEARSNVANLLPKNLYNQMSPLTAIVRSYGLILAYLLFIGAILLAASLLRVKFLGIALNAALLLAGTGLCLLDSSWMWAFPCSHALTWVHFTLYFAKPICPIWVSYLYFLGSAGLFTAFACFLAGRRSFDSILEFDGA